MLGVVAALVVTVLIAWVPGLAVCGALLPGVGRVARFAVAPAVSYALAYALASYLDLVGAPVTWWSVALPLGLVGAVVHVAQLRSGRLAPPRPRLAHLALLLAALVAYGLWMHAVGSAQPVPAYDDGANAGIFVHRLGVLQTAKDLGKFSIGVDSNQNYLHPGSVLTSMQKGVDVAVENALTDANFKPGLTVLGLKENGAGYALDDNNKALITADMKAAADKAKEEIIAGKIEVHDYSSDNKCPY